MDADHPSRLLTGFIIAVGVAVVALLTALVILVSADDGDGGVARPTTTPPETTSTITSPSTSTTTAVDFDGDTASKRAEGTPFATSAPLEGVRFAAREGFTRVVFDFAGSDVPWWSAEYVPGPDFEGSAGTITVEGDAFLRVTVSGDADSNDSGPDSFDVDSPVLTQIVLVDEVDGIGDWVIGVDGGERPFRVGTLLDPVRIYVDIRG